MNIKTTASFYVKGKDGQVLIKPGQIIDAGQLSQDENEINQMVEDGLIASHEIEAKASRRGKRK